MEDKLRMKPVEVNLVNKVSSTDQLTDVAQQTYDLICDILQLPIQKRPKLYVLTKDKATRMKINGDYLAKDDAIRLSPSSVKDHYTIVHELIHAVCRKELRYLGSHGIPYIVLHDLVVAYYMDNPALGNGHVVDVQWSRLAPARAKSYAKEEAAEIVKQIHASIGPVELLAQKPSILELADLVARSEAGKYCFNRKTNFKSLLRLFDRTWTQKRAVYGVISWFLGLLFIVNFVGIFLAQYFYSTYKEAWLQKISVNMLFAAVIIAILLTFYNWVIKKFTGFDVNDNVLND